MNHIQIEALSYCAPVRKWLMERYEKEADRIWEKTVQNYGTDLASMQNHGGLQAAGMVSVYYDSP